MWRLDSTTKSTLASEIRLWLCGRGTGTAYRAYGLAAAAVGHRFQLQPTVERTHEAEIMSGDLFDGEDDTMMEAYDAYLASESGMGICTETILIDQKAAKDLFFFNF